MLMGIIAQIIGEVSSANVDRGGHDLFQAFYTAAYKVVPKVLRLTYYQCGGNERVVLHIHTTGSVGVVS